MHQVNGLFACKGYKQQNNDTDCYQALGNLVY